MMIFKEHEAGMKTTDICRKHGVSESTFYNWQGRKGGHVQRMKGLEDENSVLRKLLADTMLDNAALKDLLKKTR